MELRGARQTEELSRDELMHSRCSVQAGCRELRTSPLKWGLWHLTGWKSAFDLCFCSQVLVDHLSKINTRRLWTSHHNRECFKHTLHRVIISNYLETFPSSYFPTQPFFPFIFVRLLWIYRFDFSKFQTNLTPNFILIKQNCTNSYISARMTRWVIEVVPPVLPSCSTWAHFIKKVCMYRRTAPTVSKWWTAFRFFCHSIKRNPSLPK